VSLSGRRWRTAACSAASLVTIYTFALGYLRDSPGKLVELASLLGHDSLGMGDPQTTAPQARRLRLIEQLLEAGAGLDDLDPEIIRQLGQLGRRYDAGDLRRFAKPKRDALVACYLVEARKTLLDQIVEMNDLFLIGMNRRSRNSVENQRKGLRRRARDGLHCLLGTIDALVAAEGSQTVTAFRDALGTPALIEAAIACRAYERLEERGHLDALLARYSTLRQYLPAFFALPFQAAAGSETILEAIEIVRALDAGTRDALTTDDPHGFVQADWRSHLISGGKLDRAIWEIALAFAVRDALRAGSLFLVQSRDHVSFWNLVYDDRKWQQSREQAYQRLALPTDGRAFLAKLTAEFERVARAAERGLPGNRFAAIVNGRLKLKKRDALAVSRAVHELRATIGASLPRVRIEDLLQDVDEWCRFTKAFQPLGGYQPRGADLHRSLLATVIAHGTNLGLAAMSQSVDTLTAEALQDTSRWFLRDATIKAANTILVNHHHGLELSRIWGDGSRSSSDGQRFAVERRSLLGSVYPRYFGYYDQALQLYTHTSDQNSVYGTRAISCGPREAGYVLGGRPPPNPSSPEEENPSMPKTNQGNWQPISQMALISSMIDTSLNDTREHLGTLSKAKDRPHVLDDATIDRVEQVHTEQMNYVDIYTQQSAAGARKSHRPLRHANWTAWRRRTNSFGGSLPTSSSWPANCAKAPSTASWR
jgi:hypothetical protein